MSAFMMGEADLCELDCYEADQRECEPDELCEAAKALVRHWFPEQEEER